MNIALFKKTFRDSWFLLTVAFLAVAIFEVLAILAFYYLIRDANRYFAHMPDFVGRLVSVLAGTDIRRNFTPTGLMSIAYAHPVVHIVLWAWTITYCTRVFAGEIERGTADLLLSLPISRTRIYATVSAVWIIAGLLLSAAPLAGTWYAQTFLRRGPFEFDRLALVSVNLFMLYLAIGAASLMVSALFSRRGQAVGAVVAVLVASFVLNFLSALWEPAKNIAFLGVLDYYRPVPIIDSGEWPVHSMKVLGGAALVCWVSGWIVFSRRDVRTG